MKKLIVTLFIALLCTQAFAETILIMDTIEFNTLRHTVGRQQYVNKLTAVLKKMRLKQGDFDAMNADSEGVYALILSDSRWQEITTEIEKSCKKPAQKNNCRALEKIRLDTFDFIKAHPQNYAEDEPKAATR